MTYTDQWTKSVAYTYARNIYIADDNAINYIMIAVQIKEKEYSNALYEPLSI